QLDELIKYKIMATLKELKELLAEQSAVDIAIAVSGFTGFRTTLLEELTQEEIDKLYNIHAPKPEPTMDEEFNALKYELVLKEWRSKILALAEREGIKEPKSWHKFNDWMILYSIYKKPLTAHNIEELKELYKQFRGIERNNRKFAEKPLNKAWWRKAGEIKNLN
ncbi:hypothetical protein, partial [Riemerella columbipharyngis]